MHQATRFQFERTVKEFAEWRAVCERQRSPAAAWWWGPALAVLDEQQPMPQQYCDDLEMESGSSYAAAGRKLIAAIAEQTTLPWPNLFPRQTTPHADEPQDILSTT
ncbi:MULTISPECIES: hypothetical protein [Rhodopseudomonas]|uniref:Uncharacterized protein n=1 Tax=Rhodopseudomonas palustris TaxID=1076 RepID=A0A0D7EFZ5_RHOPL|nr:MULTISPECIES: hypothetical protein [Rhodopseudomonas]KIZ39586.1 hypothetical protein OO17_19985 [Rhodopseudomonas palustris]MDF3813839.1 hypothetical protein [Rhodopseudomonas sp. BAL398]WOK15431.1 hypothetical protein RBJ75_14645 [Rhodopseudomonas sp. BAL398]